MCFDCFQSEKYMKPLHFPLYVYHCEKCKKTFNSQKKYNKHIKKYHKKNNKHKKNNYKKI